MMAFQFEDAFETKKGDTKMEQDQKTQNNLIVTTDCLEAVGVLKSWKNFLFVIIILCLLLSQLSFWLVNTNIIKTEPQKEEGPAIVAAETKPKNPYRPQQAAIPAIKTFTDANSINQNKEQQAETRVKKALAFFKKIDFEELSWAVRFANFVLLLSSFLYCLSMLLILKVSLVGRLGGINHITRAFFLSLTFVVLLFPWQIFFKEVIVGAMYLPQELPDSLIDARDAGTIGQVYLYLRYCLYWVIVLFLAICAQIRSKRWAKASLRRLDVA
jgi:hypothetical protein